MKESYDCAKVRLNWLCGLSLEVSGTTQLHHSGTQQVTLLYAVYFHAEGHVHVWTRGP